MRSKENPINLSTASLWPGASLLSTRWAEGIAERAGCEGLEILPGYSVVREFRRHGELLVPASSIVSFHQDWRRDRRAEVEKRLRTDTNRSLKARVISKVLRGFFPREKVCLQTVQGLETFYGVPVVFHWPEDTSNFKKRSLEVHPWINMSPLELVRWVEDDPRTRSLALDISQRKFGDYLTSQNIPKDDWQKVFGDLLPFASEIHFQIGNGDELKQVLDKNYDSTLGEAVREITTQGFEGPFVIEANPLFFFKIPSTEFFASTVDFIHLSQSDRNFPGASLKG